MKNSPLESARLTHRQLTRRHLLSAAALAPAALAWERVAFAAPLSSVPTPTTIRLALITDTHTTRGTNEDQALYKLRFEAVIRAVNEAGVDFILMGGDLTQSSKPEEFADFRAQIKGLNAPIAGMVAGNHDVGAKKIEGSDGGVSMARVERYEAEMGESFWVRESAGLRVVGVNASLFGSGLPREAAQWEFLERTLGAEASPSVRQPTILLTHYPVFLKTADEPSDPYWNIDPVPRARLLQLIEKSGVRGVLSGHIHRPLLNQYGGATFITAPPVSFGLPRGKQPQGWTLVTVSLLGEITHEHRSIER